jgi:hypothetical protein
MRSIFTTVVVGFICLAVGLCVGVLQGNRLRQTEPGQLITSVASKVPWSKPGGTGDSQIESSEYPTIKWKPQQLSDAPDAIVRLWTTYAADSKDATQGAMKYKLTLFKATQKDGREVQMLDSNGFKILQFNASDFHAMPGAPDIVEARDSVPCSEDQYKNASDYSVK